ncbi:MAG: NAD(P)H-quinone oxidoreductase [Gammaproteobacteria bacterium]
MTDTMKAISIVEPGGPEVLELSDVPRPEPSDDEVLLQVQAAGVNRPDCLQRQGLYPLPPGASALPGLEVAGTVVAVGKNVTEWRLGEKVVALTHGGGYAEYCLANKGHCLTWPQNLSAVEAAAAVETTFTVQSNLFTRAQLKRDERVLIHGGSSGIGATAIQLAKLNGAWVVATAGSADKVKFCLDLGADVALNHKDCEWDKEILALTENAGVDVVLDMVAGPYVPRNISILAADGRYSMIAFLLGPKSEVNFAPVLTKRLTLTASTLRPQSIEQKTLIRNSVREAVWPHLISGQFTVPIYRTFSLGEAADAHRLMESSEHMGKIVLEVPN